LSRHNVTPRLSKRKKKQAEINAKTEEDTLKINFRLKQINPLTDMQSETWDAFYSKKNLLLHGVAGTGKSFISLYLALRELTEDNIYKKIVIIRSVVPTRDMGFLPGSIAEKIKIYEDPYRQIFGELFGRSDAYDYIKSKHAVEFISTSFVRGTTFNDCIVIVDEMQNMDWGELSSVITRAGKNCKMIFCGDVRQSDFRFKERFNKDDIIDFVNVLKKMDEFKLIEFGINDIVRSKLVKSFIINSIELGRDIT
jgi:phosphate starvation-inducible PhoH-like protein